MCQTKLHLEQFSSLAFIYYLLKAPFHWCINGGLCKLLTRRKKGQGIDSNLRRGRGIKDRKNRVRTGLSRMSIHPGRT